MDQIDQQNRKEAAGRFLIRLLLINIFDIIFFIYRRFKTKKSKLNINNFMDH